jgi:hypothetical protein
MFFSSCLSGFYISSSHSKCHNSKGHASRSPENKFLDIKPKLQEALSHFQADVILQLVRVNIISGRTEELSLVSIPPISPIPPGRVFVVLFLAARSGDIATVASVPGDAGDARKCCSGGIP